MNTCSRRRRAGLMLACRPVGCGQAISCIVVSLLSILSFTVLCGPAGSDRRRAVFH